MPDTRKIITLLLTLLAYAIPVETQAARMVFVVADSASRQPLRGAAVFDVYGNTVGISRKDGSISYPANGSFPLTVRYMGYKEKTVANALADSVFLEENLTELPEVKVESRSQKVMHILAYVREYSTLSTYTDTVTLFREKMVDFMLVPDRKIRFKGWRNPRVLKCKSYYHFTNSNGLDSVSDESGYHFSWSDWIGIPSEFSLPASLRHEGCGLDTVRGKYGVSEVWTKTDDRLSVDVDVLADTTNRKWVPSLSGFFRNGIDFDYFNLRFNYDNIYGESVSPMNLTGYSFNMDSNGRGHGMFMFNRVDEPFFVNTYAEVYLLDNEYITVKEARKWERQKFDSDEIKIFVPDKAPELQASTLALIDRVNRIDRGQVRLDQDPDHRYLGGIMSHENFGTRLLSLLKNMTGISSIRMKYKNEKQWKKFRKDRVRANKNRK